MDQKLKGLASRLRNGDKKAFEEIYAHFHRKIYLFCLSYGLSVTDAEEITQEVFVKLWLNRNSIDPEKKLNSYVYKIGKNIIIDEFKKRIKTTAVYEYQMALILPTNDVEETMDYMDLKALMDKTLVHLPERRRKVFELSRLKGLSHKEIALELGISTKTVENHLNLALQNFRIAFQEANSIVYLFIFTGLF
ncbi:RNA polymerase sigma-70 factor (ECF subfamily) [Algoriphagus sp. 4150]|uniref:RNA polymerase sigma factor n=1 Tax=Algoriphagus sp. 4150 TaxID=2817756 RepID=UPI002863AAA3|nr:RNA polymerase sigma-70 factor [Algoriphagus sp. 4150]MDR7129455.1 RNA polymerase sigma-70 factor (ECF subfamily) [Algoriphagus sp. 4150]